MCDCGPPTADRAAAGSQGIYGYMICRMGLIAHCFCIQITHPIPRRPACAGKAVPQSTIRTRKDHEHSCQPGPRGGERSRPCAACRIQRADQAGLPPAADQRRPGPSQETDLGPIQHLCVLDVRRAQRGRLHHGRQPVCAGPLQLAGAGVAAGGHRDRAVLLQPGGQAQPGDGRALPRGVPRLVRRAGRQHSGHHPRADCGGLVRRANVPCVGGLHGAGAAHVPQPRAVCRRGAARLCGPVDAGLGGVHDHVGIAGLRVLARHGSDPQVHRLGRPGRVRGDGHPLRLAGVEGGLAQHRPEPGRHQVPGLGRAARDALGHCAGGELLQRARCSTLATSRATERASTR